MKRWLVVWGLILIVLIAACGGDDDGGNGDESTNGDTAQTVLPTRVPGPRERALPSGDPHEFEAPFSAGQFVREATQGRATAIRAAGLQAIYRQDQTSVVLNVYRFDAPEQAVETVRFALSSATITQFVVEPVYRPYTSYGVAQDRHGGHMAAWSNNEWAFIARTSGDLNTLNAFLDAFPY